MVHGSTTEGWAGRLYHLGNDKEVFDAETYAIFRVLKEFDRRQESGCRYTIFANSTAAINRIRSDAIGPGQHLARAAVEICSRLVSRDNEVTVLWVPAHVRIAGNEEADRLAKEAAEGRTREASDEYRWEASLSHLSQVVTENRSRAAAQWVASHVKPERRYRPPGVRPPKEAAAASPKIAGGPLLPAAVRACCYWIFSARVDARDAEARVERALVVQQR